MIGSAGSHTEQYTHGQTSLSFLLRCSFLSFSHDIRVSYILPSISLLSWFFPFFFFVCPLLPPRFLFISLLILIFLFSLQSFLTLSIFIHFSLSSFLQNFLLSSIFFPFLTIPVSFLPFFQTSSHCARYVTVFCFVKAREVIAHSSASSRIQKAVKSRFTQIRVGDDTLSGRDQSSWCCPPLVLLHPS